MCGPVLVEQQQQLLGAAQHKHGQQHTPAALDDRVNQCRKAHLLLEARLETLGAVGTLADQHVGPHGRHLGLHEVSVLFTAIVARVQHTQPGNVDQKHARAQHMARMVGREPQTAAHHHLLVVVDRLDLAPRRKHLGLVKQHAVAARVRDAHKVGHEEAVDRLGRVRHVHFALPVAEVGLFHDVGERRRMVEVEVRNEQRIHRAPVDLVEEGQRGKPRVRRMHCVSHGTYRPRHTRY